jgi:hypothetical protein
VQARIAIDAKASNFIRMSPIAAPACELCAALSKRNMANGNCRRESTVEVRIFRCHVRPFDYLLRPNGRCPGMSFDWTDSDVIDVLSEGGRSRAYSIRSPRRWKIGSRAEPEDRPYIAPGGRTRTASCFIDSFNARLQQAIQRGYLLHREGGGSRDRKLAAPLQHPKAGGSLGDRGDRRQKCLSPPSPRGRPRNPGQLRRPRKRSGQPRTNVRNGPVDRGLIIQYR